MPRIRLVRLAVVAAAVLFIGRRGDAQLPASTDVSLDSLLNTQISAASKYAQRSGDAPASVTIISSDDIRNFGYRNLQEVLETVPGFYVSNDRNYAYFGVRGFSRTTDYNSRMLLLIDGHSMNDQVWGAAPLGTDLPLNLDVVERVEIVQGPGSAMYGTGAVFAVINIVTKSARALDGGIVRGSIGSGGERVAGLTVGHVFGGRASVTASGLTTHTAGGDHYYSEFDTPETLRGVARGLDWERGASGYARLDWADVTVTTGYRTRSKGVPTASYGTLFGDTREASVDKTLWGDIKLKHQFGATVQLSARLYGDRVHYTGSYPYDANAFALHDAGGSNSTGGEVIVDWAPISRWRLIAGTEDKLVSRAGYGDINSAGVRSHDDKPFSVFSGFVQSELQMLPSAMLVAGVRADHYSTVGSATTPRVGLILTPVGATTIKLLYGEAFRAPSAIQSSLTAGAFVANPALRPERIKTTELNVQQRLGEVILVGASVYRYVLHDLIDQQLGAANEVRFMNLSYAEASGVQFEVEARPSALLAAHLSYVLQKAQDAQGADLTNSPRHVGNLGITAQPVRGVRSALQLRYESARRTRAGWTSSFLRTDATTGWRPSSVRSPWLSSTEVSLRVGNVFNVAYATPTGPSNVQDVIAADGRTYALRLEWRF
jgi:iron complex outermembrane receptor protein